MVTLDDKLDAVILLQNNWYKIGTMVCSWDRRIDYIHTQRGEYIVPEKSLLDTITLIANFIEEWKLYKRT